MTNTDRANLQSGEGLPLLPHASSAHDGVDSVVAGFSVRDGLLTLDYKLFGDIENIILPDQSPPSRTDELWRHTCFEAFISDGNNYCEFNFSPSNQWAAYRFSKYRGAPIPVDIHTPPIKCVTGAAPLHLYTELSLASLPLSGARPWRLGLSAVVETHRSGLSYWALRHEEGPPDFHRASCFTAQIP